MTEPEKDRQVSHGHRKHTYGYQRGGGGKDKVGVWN